MTFYMNSLLYNSLKKRKNCTIDDNDPIMLLSIQTFKNDYDGFIKLYPHHHQELVFKTLKTDKDYKKFVAKKFCIIMNSGLYNDIEIKPKAKTLITFPATDDYLHGTRKVTSGSDRFVIATFVFRK